MSEAKHTPGPWTIYERAERDCGTRKEMLFHIGNDTVQHTVCECDCTENASVIAAAPELLAACEAALRIEELWMPFEWDDPDEAAAVSLMRDLFVAAIAKAKGE
jgi:hypothetical protein